MQQRRSAPVLLAFGFVAAGSAVATFGSGAAQAGPPPTQTGGADRFDPAPSRGAIDPAVLPAALDDDRQVTVIVEMAAEPVAVVEAQQGRKLSASEKQAVRDRLRADQGAAAAQIAAAGGSVGATMQS